MSPERFRELGHRMVDFVAGYVERVGEQPVLSRAVPGAVFGALPDSPLERGPEELSARRERA